MAMDIGGLDYRIKVADESGPPVQSFRDNIRAAKLEWRAFKDELQSRRRSSSNLDQELDRVARAADRAARATAKVAAADRKAATDAGRRARAVSDANKAYDKKVRADELAARSAIRNFAAERRLASATRQRAQAEDAITRILERRRRAENIINAARARGISLTDQEARSLKLLSAEQLRLLKAKERLAAISQDSKNTGLTQIKAETEALRRQQAVRQEAATQAVLASRGLDPSGQIVEPGKPEQKGIAVAIRNLLGLNRAMDDSEVKARRTGFTFRRLFGVFIGFSIIRQFTASFRDLVREIVVGSAAIERQTLGLAAQLAAVGDVRDMYGKAAQGAERFAIAESEARKQIQKLSLDALDAGLNFDGLLDAMTQALGPGLQAGFDVDQVRQFTKQISIAARIIGVEGTQLAEEVRSVLSGSISQRNTRVASALGITAEDIRQAKESGELFEFLTERFDVYNLAADKAGKTFEGLTGKLRLGIRRITTAGGLVFFTELKNLLQEVTDKFTQVNTVTGEIELNPGMVEVVRLISEGLTTAVVEARRLITTLQQGDVEAVARGFADLFSLTVRTLSDLIQGAVIGVAFIVNAVEAIGAVFRDLTGFALFDNGLLHATLVLIGAISAAVFALAAPLIPLLLLTKTLQIAWLGVLSAVKLLRSAAIAFNVIEKGAKLSGLALGALTGKVLLLVSLFLLVAATGRFALKALQGDTKATENSISDMVGRGFAGMLAMEKMYRETMLGNKDAVRVFREEMQMLKADQDANNDSASLAKRIFGDFFRSAATEVKALGKDLDNALKPDEEEGFVLGQSEAIKELRDSIKELNDEADRARDSTKATLAGIGLPAGVAEQAQTFATAIAQGLRLSNNLLRERADVLKQIQAIQKEREEKLLPEDFDRAREVALTERLDQLNSNILVSRKLVLDAAFAELEAAASLNNEELRRANAALNIEAAHARNLRIFELEGNARKLALETAEKELALANLAAEQEEETAGLGLATQREILQTVKDRVVELEKIAAIERTPEQNDALDTARRLVEEKTNEVRRLEENLRLQRLIREEELNRLQTEQIKASIADEAPIGAGIVEGLQQAFDEVSDGFTTTVEIMRSTVRDFSAFIASSIVDAFDPTNDTDLQERFARFLQGLATQILTTLITLAITAIALNAASGGLLGPLLQGYATAGRNAGGVVGIGRHKGGRAGPGRHRAFQGAGGYAEGGSPGERREHGVLRPSGLHPADTVPIWADPSEWIIRGRSVMKAGADAIQRINEGMFDPAALRAATGLTSFRRTVAFARSGKGMVMGGSAASAASAAAQGSSATSSDRQRPVPAYITSGNDATARLLSGGGNAMKSWLADNGYFPQQR